MTNEKAGDGEISWSCIIRSASVCVRVFVCVLRTEDRSDGCQLQQNLSVAGSD